MTGDTPSAPPEVQTRKGPEGGRAIERAAAVLMELAHHPKGITLSELSRRTGVAIGTLHRTLAILRGVDLVRETSDGRVALGAGTAVLAGAFFDGLDIRSEARPLMSEIATRTGETVHLGVLSSPNIVYIEKLDSPSAVRMVSRIGGTNPVVTTGIGKAILAFSPEDVVSRVISDSRLILGELVDAGELRAELQATVERGFSTDPEANEPGIWCVGAPIFDNSGVPVAGLSVSTPTHRFDRAGESELGAYVSAMAAEISRRMGYLPPSGESGPARGQSGTPSVSSRRART